MENRTSRKTTIELIKNRSDIGAGTRGADLGIDAIEIAAINQGSDFFIRHPHRDVPTRNEVIYEKERSPYAKHIKEVYEQCRQLSSVVAASLHQGNFPLIFSGDHSSAIGTITGIKAAFPEKRLGVIWIDAHADIHSPYTTPSGNIHGMPLAAVLQEDNRACELNEIESETAEYWSKLKSLGDHGTKLQPSDLIYFGVRDTEEPEDAIIERLHIKNFKVEEVRRIGIDTCVVQTKNLLQDCDIVYVSFDVDSMDSEMTSEGTGTPVPRGFAAAEVSELLERLVSSLPIVALETVEVNPLLDTKGNKMAEIAFGILDRISPIIEHKT